MTCFTLVLEKISAIKSKETYEKYQEFIDDHLYNYYHDAKVFFFHININNFRADTKKISISLKGIHFRNIFKSIEKASCDELKDYISNFFP